MAAITVSPNGVQLHGRALREIALTSSESKAETEEVLKVKILNDKLNTSAGVKEHFIHFFVVDEEYSFNQFKIQENIYSSEAFNF